MQSNLLKYETSIWEKGIDYIAGIDEVGRGALAGPLVAAAVILDKSHLLNEPIWSKDQSSFLSSQNPGHSAAEKNDVSSEILDAYSQIKDSKLVAPKKRERLADFIKENAISYSIERVEHTIIDDVGIMEATQIAFFNAVQNLNIKAEHIFTDTFPVKKITMPEQTNIPSGDKLSISVAAASIIAKVFRDSLMVDLHNRVEEYQKYYFNKHKGYGTQLHRDMIFKHGPCNIHRRRFEPIRSMLRKV